MGRPPCCDKLGVKKGPWTPEEDALLISFVDDNGPGNWRAVPTKTGLKRCSKSCRLRWTNYLRPGIKRGTFTDQEEKMIYQLQALLGNKWAAIASYLPERTDNDIKNYWNTHLKKKLKRLENGSGQNPTRVVGSSNNPNPVISRGQWERRLQCDDISSAKQALHDALTVENDQPCSNSNYASSTENIARLLKDWVKNTPKFEESSSSSSKLPQDLFGEGKNGNVELSEAFEALFGFEPNFTSNNKSNCDDHFSRSTSPSGEVRPDPTGQLAPLSVLENWLLDDQGNKDCLANFSFDENPNLF